MGATNLTGLNVVGTIETTGALTVGGAVTQTGTANFTAETNHAGGIASAGAVAITGGTSLAATNISGITNALGAAVFAGTVGVTGTSNFTAVTNHLGGIVTAGGFTGTTISGSSANFSGIINSTVATTGLELASTANVYIGGNRVVSAQQANIAWVNSDAPNNNTRINAIISALEAHGLLAAL